MLFRTLALIAAAAGFLTAADSKDIHRAFPLDGNGHVTIDTYKGSIRVSAWDRNEVEVDVLVEEDGGPFAQTVEHADVRFDASPSDLRITSKIQWSFFLDGVAPLYHYTVRMPRTASLRIKDYKSETVVSGLSARLDVNTYKGSVELRNHAGGLAVNTYKGEVRGDFAAMAGPSRLETYKGRVDLRIPRESRFDLYTDLGRRADLDSDFSRDRALRSAVNGGGPELRLKSYKGEFRLRAR